MQTHDITPEQRNRAARRKERRRQKAARRAEELRRQIELLRRQIADARRRRQCMLLLLLLAILAMKQSILTAISYSITQHPKAIPAPTGWMPDPHNDFAPRKNEDDFCDGYSFAQWTRLSKERGITLSRKAERDKAWKGDPDFHLFPLRYQDWGHRPYIGQVMEELKTPYWQQDALVALKLLTPREVHLYLDEAYALDLGELRQCFADRDADILKAMQTRAILWEERKKSEAEEARKAQNRNKPDEDSNEPNP